MSTAVSGSWPPPPPQRSRRDVLASIAVAVVLLLLFGLRFWWRWQDFTSQQRRANATSTTVGMAPTHPFADTVSPQRLPAGTCLDRAPVMWARVVPCDQPHVAEVVSLVPYAASDTSGYPTVLDVVNQTLDRCQADFAAYTGGAPGKSVASPFVAPPERYDWNLGERKVVCFATARDGADLTRSVRAGG